ncbi:hypothetical protein [Kitasatospora sp. NPDC002040]|uniref:hypothetical protein n=1 Tax=Kitasatospora sp. NPDC002040 TaxID=3154661 RepID=UPI00331C56B1
MPLPAWMRADEPALTHDDHPLAALADLAIWLDAPATRTRWSELRRSREIAELEAERVAGDARFGSQLHRRASVVQVARAAEQLAHAEARTRLSALAAELADLTRARLITTVTDDTTAATVPGLAEDAVLVSTGIRQLLADLTETRHSDPREMLHQARAVLPPLLSASAACTATPATLREWASEVALAVTVLGTILLAN